MKPGTIHPSVMTMKIRILLFFLIIAAFLFTASNLQAGPAALDERPRIGLVLSGGGARGLAHVGVIQVLEEMKIPISCIAGTSMGRLSAEFTPPACRLPNWKSSLPACSGMKPSKISRMRAK